MGLIEVYFGSIAGIITMIGLAQGYARELGRSMIIIVAIFLLLYVQDRLNPILDSVWRMVFSAENIGAQQLFLSNFYLVTFVVIIFAGYAGRVITFSGQQWPMPQGAVLSCLVGAVNGYLISGSLWYYQHIYGYPLANLGWINPDLSPIATELVRYLPQNVMPSPTPWVIPIAILLLMRVRG
ncbi:MAG: hypothetical protein OXF54_21470 [Caldilineaceae bacterium]|uniref:CvpA family protein n=1 Tax=Caldilineaceae bacterium SB0675_bin_29 TaxID=2605266 RepID=A0A6B1FZR4_9CHLR|nr:hypothetical protein [Caldilineaceae bacterium]MYH60656.1 hypothetical protein [Caldilineaceae bacterium SB0675_bin_29]